MNLSDRLRGILAPARPSSLAGRLPAGPSGSSLPPIGRGGRTERDLCADLDGAWHAHGAARCFVVERRIEADTGHGDATVGALAERLDRASACARLVADRVRLPFLFFDLETTGLSGGAGTYAFLVGLGRFDRDGAFVTTQYLLTQFSEERPLLQLVDERLAAAGTLVSFNGKSFDAPVLETRYLFHRLPWRGAELPHLDLLHPARRFWGRRPQASESLADEAGCSLIALETDVLAAARDGDVPGFEIPGRYFSFVRSGDARPLRPVLEHNRRDLLSLAALTSRVCHLLQEGVDAARTALEALAIGRVYAQAGDEDRARAALIHAAERGRDVHVIAAARRALAMLSRRARRFDEAAVHWRLLLECRGCPPQLLREASEALAIHHEHRVRDFEAARAFALHGLRTDGGRPAWAAAVTHRVTRIERKMKAREADGLTRRLELGEEPA